MKKYSALLLAVVFIATVFTGCGCRNSKPMETTTPTVPATSAPVTQATEPSTTPAVPSTDATIEDGNGPMPTNATAGEDGDTSTTETDAARNRSRGNTENTEATNGSDRNRSRIMPNN